MEKVSQFELDSFLEKYKNVSTEEIIKSNKLFKLVLFIHHKTTLFIIFWLATMCPFFILLFFAGLNELTYLIGTVMFLIYPLLFFIYKKTILKDVDIENEYFQRKVQMFEYILEKRKGA